MSADLDGNNITDLIVRNAGDGTISVYAGDGSGWFQAPVTLQVGLGASDIEVADLQQDGLLDIVYTNRISGEVGVLENLGGGSFGSPVLYQAGPGPYGVTGTADPSPVSSLEGTTSVAAGVFTPDGPHVARRTQSRLQHFWLLDGPGRRRAHEPDLLSRRRRPVWWFGPLTLPATDFPGWPSSPPADCISTFPTATEAFWPPTEYNVGFEPNGLTVADLTGNGKADLLVSNPLRRRANLDRQWKRHVSARPKPRPASRPCGLCDQRQHAGRVHLHRSAHRSAHRHDRRRRDIRPWRCIHGLISPGAVTLADLNNNGILDLIVANSGSNNVLVFPGLGNGAFGSGARMAVIGFFTGTDPVGDHGRRSHRQRPARSDHRQRGVQRRFHPAQCAGRQGGFTFERGRDSRPALGRSRRWLPMSSAMPSPIS